VGRQRSGGHEVSARPARDGDDTIGVAKEAPAQPAGQAGLTSQPAVPHRQGGVHDRHKGGSDRAANCPASQVGHPGHIIGAGKQYVRLVQTDVTSQTRNTRHQPFAAESVDSLRAQGVERRREERPVVTDDNELHVVAAGEELTCQGDADTLCATRGEVCHHETDSHRRSMSPPREDV
jgi:hypothetical protein